MVPKRFSVPSVQHARNRNSVQSSASVHTILIVQSGNTTMWLKRPCIFLSWLLYYYLQPAIGTSRHKKQFDFGRPSWIMELITTTYLYILYAYGSVIICLGHRYSSSEGDLLSRATREFETDDNGHHTWIVVYAAVGLFFYFFNSLILDSTLLWHGYTRSIFLHNPTITAIRWDIMLLRTRNTI